MGTIAKLRAYARVLPTARRHRSDLVRYLARRPSLLLGVGAYELALLASDKVDNRTKALAMVKASSLVGCPF